MAKTNKVKSEEIEAQIGRLEIFPGLKLSEKHSSNIFHKSVKTDDPAAILLDKAYGIFLEGLAFARKGDLKRGAEKICNAFLIDQRSIKYIPKNEICNELEMFVLDNSLWQRLRDAAKFFDTQVNMEILTIVAHFCVASCVSNMKSNQNRIGQALRSIEKLLQLIEDIPLIKHHYQAMGCDLSKKFLFYLRSYCYLDLDNRELAEKDLNTALHIDPAYFKARLQRVLLWRKHELVPFEDVYKEMKLIVGEMHPDCPDLARICMGIAMLALKYPKLGNLGEVREYYNKTVHAFRREMKIYEHKDLSLTYNKLLNLQKRLTNDRYMEGREKMDMNIANKTRIAEGRPNIRVPTGPNFFSYYMIDNAANKKHSCMKCKSEVQQILKKCPQCNSVSYCSEGCLNKDRDEHTLLCKIIHEYVADACNSLTFASGAEKKERFVTNKSGSEVGTSIQTVETNEEIDPSPMNNACFGNDKQSSQEDLASTKISTEAQINEPSIAVDRPVPFKMPSLIVPSEYFDGFLFRCEVMNCKKNFIPRNLGEEKRNNISPITMGSKSNDPEALILDEACEMFKKGLSDARNGDLVSGMHKISLAFLLDERSIKYVHSNQVEFAIDSALLEEMMKSSSGNIIISDILRIIPGIFADSCGMQKGEENELGLAIRSIENLLQLIEEYPSIGKAAEGKLSRQKLLYLWGLCSERLCNQLHASTLYRDALVIDPSHLPTRRKRASLWLKYGMRSPQRIHTEMKRIAKDLHEDSIHLETVYEMLVLSTLKFPELGTLQKAKDYFIEFQKASKRKKELYGNEYFYKNHEDLLLSLGKLFSKASYIEARKAMDKAFSAGQRFLNHSEENDLAYIFSEIPNIFEQKSLKYSCKHCQIAGEKIAQCSDCKSVNYCSRKCQIADWKQHKFICKIIIETQKANLVRRQTRMTQSIWRGMLARKSPLSEQVTHLSQFRKFYKLWKPCFDSVMVGNNKDINWASIKEKQAFIRQQDIFQDADIREADEKLNDAITHAMTSDAEVNDSDANIETQEIDYSVMRENKSDNNKSGTREVIRKIHLTADTEKWLRTCDSKYRDFFIRRIKQLASGDTSRILRKRLKGSTRTIYEVYLEQKSGFRILWTEEGDQVLIWYVAKHKNVSRLIKLIDDSRNRSDKARVYIDDVEGLDDINSSITKNNRDRKEILLDPLGNVPLKRYEVTLNDIDELSTGEWKSSLVLTEEEREVVETKGTVLLLGRSGTGKTICICNRMEYDRLIHTERDHFTQLFVARSAKLCRYVEGVVGNKDGCEMVTFHDLRDHLENELPTLGNIQDDYTNWSDKYMGFFRFKKEMFSNGTIYCFDPLVVWTNIRSFIKGSIEALRSERGYLSKEEYLALGKKRCRFSEEQRETIYGIFQRYQDFMDANGLWDESDRIIALLRRLKRAREANPELVLNSSKTWAKFDKVYVDEVQDYTQVEILLFFVLGGAGNLFLAGDPAQNVARGVEFRFADIRSVGYYVAGNDEGKKELIPQKPKMVNINFRSHAGILQCAASILAEMFHHFPDSVKMLRKDAGLFQGPRPEVLPAVDARLMQNLIKSKLNGVVVLTHDENVEQVKEKLGGYELVYGIRHCKGLEFKSVIIMDFFCNISSDLQTPWKEMLIHRADNVYSNDFALQYPEIEAQLKLLYTAVTRCIERLFFVETITSKVGDAFIRWSTTTSVTPFGPNDKRDKAIATLSDCTNIESMGLNRDEWLAAGLSNAEAADAEEYDFENKCSLLKKAVYCFEQGRHDLFVRKAKVQLRGIELRMKISDIDSNDVDLLGKIEKEAVCIIRGLFEADMGSEVLELCKSLRAIMNKLYPSSDFLQRYLISKGT